MPTSPSALVPRDSWNDGSMTGFEISIDDAPSKSSSEDEVKVIPLDEQLTAIRAALAGAGEAVESSEDEDDEENLPSMTQTPSRDDYPNEVLYNEGATDLFLACEESHWTKALDVLRALPWQARCWVQSTGTVETTFEWSLWRRLPLHEACRRQAPAWLVAKLLAAYPQSAAAATQFGELPLHLAVESGAAPEVVNLLIVAHWPSIAAKDQSGRTPVEILSETDLLDHADHQVVVESLSRSRATYEAIMAERAAQMQALQAKHAAGLLAIKKQHDDDLQAEAEQQEGLLREIERLKTALTNAGRREKESAATIQAFAGIEADWRRRQQELSRALAEEKDKSSQKDQTIQGLQHLIADKNRRLEELSKTVSRLQADLVAERDYANGVLARKFAAAETSIQTMLGDFFALSDMAEQHRVNLGKLMEARDIPVEMRNRPPSTPSPREEKKDETEDVYAGDETVAVESAAAAATEALLRKD